MEPTSGIEPLTCRLRMPKADTSTNSVNDLRPCSMMLSLPNHANWQLNGIANGNAQDIVRGTVTANIPEIHVADYVVSGIRVNPARSNEDTPVRAGFVVATQSVYLPINL